MAQTTDLPTLAGISPVISTRGLTKVYRMGAVDVHALRGVDVDLYPGEFVVLLGPSGSGKSTLLNILGGLDSPTDGSVFHGGLELNLATERALTAYRRKHVGFIFQFYNLIPSLTALENVALVTDIAEDPMLAEEALELVGLSPRSAHFPSQLSGGEQQRVAIARAISKRPSLLLCDEPTGALDISTGILVLQALQEASGRTGTLTLVITHNQVIAEMADRVLSIADGRLVDDVRNEGRKDPAELVW